MGALRDASRDIVELVVSCNSGEENLIVLPRYVLRYPLERALEAANGEWVHFERKGGTARYRLVEHGAGDYSI